MRSNAALFLLCVISVATLFMLIRRSARIDNGTMPNETMPSKVVVESGASRTSADMPATSTFMNFIYEPGRPLTVSGICADAYRVVLVFPENIDYRDDPAGARYNVAKACSVGQAFTEHLDLGALNLHVGARYYVVVADQGNTGTWHDPH